MHARYDASAFERHQPTPDLALVRLAERNDVFTSLGGFSGNSFDVGPAEAPVRTPGAWVSGGFYAALELQPATEADSED